jgi:hypothetical protein
VLSLFEVSSFLTALADLISKKDKSRYLPDDTNPEELAALLSTMYWYGMRLDDTLPNLKMYTHLPCTRDTNPGFVSIAGMNSFWWTRPAVPERINLPDDDQQKQAYKIASNFAISSGIGAELIVETYIKKIHRGRSFKLFLRNIEEYENMARDFFSNVNKSHATRLTANRVSDYIFDVIARQDGADLTTAMFILGREHFLGRNPSFYTTLSIEYLQDLYGNVCREIWDRHINEGSRENKYRSILR